MTKTQNETPMDRRADDRRDSDRRQAEVGVENDRREGPRRKVQRRRQIDPTTCERDYTENEIEFMQALDAYKRANGRMFPTCSEILEVVRDLGYHRLDEEQLEILFTNDRPVGPLVVEDSESSEASTDEEEAEL